MKRRKRTATTASNRSNGDASRDARDQYCVVHNRPTGCPTCGSTSRDKLEGTLVAATPGTFDGVRYSHVKRARTKCRECGQRYVVVDYLRPAGEEKFAMRTKDQKSAADAVKVEPEQA